LNKESKSGAFVNYTLGLSQYKYKIDQKVELISKTNSLQKGKENTAFLSGITDLLFYADHERLYRKEHRLKYGTQLVFHTFIPSINEFSRVSNLQKVTKVDTTWGALNIYAPEINLYVGDEFHLNPDLSVYLGARVQLIQIGKKSYLDFQPRFSGAYTLNNQSSVKISYAKMAQLTHLITSNDNVLPTDIWLPSTSAIEPEKSHQVSAGYFYQFGRKQNFEFSVEAYYKTLSHLIELKNGSSIVGGGQAWENNLELNGKGRAYGLEFLLSKKQGKLTGWIGYTISKNERKFANINKNSWYPYKYDRPHELTLVVDYQINPIVNFTVSWVYQSGNALTLPVYKYEIDAMEWYDIGLDRTTRHYDHVFYYNGINQFRAPDYHRLDFNFNFTRDMGYGIRTWSLGVYNAYNRANPYYLYFDKNDKGELKLFAFCLFPIMPSISYSFRF